MVPARLAEKMSVMSVEPPARGAPGGRAAERVHRPGSRRLGGVARRPERGPQGLPVAPREPAAPLGPAGGAGSAHPLRTRRLGRGARGGLGLRLACVA